MNLKEAIKINVNSVASKYSIASGGKEFKISLSMRDEIEAWKLCRENNIKITEFAVYQNEKKIAKIIYKYSAKKINCCYKVLSYKVEFLEV